MRSFLVLVVGGLLSKIVGLLREVVFAALFGTSDVAAAYRVSQAAFTAPVHALVLETVSGGMVPLYKHTQKEGEDATQALVVVACAISLVIALAISVGLLLADEWAVRGLAPHANARTLDLAAGMTRMMAVAVPFYVLANLITFIETAHGHYGALSTRPTLLNVASLLAAVSAFYLHRPVLLASGVMTSHILFFVWTVAVAVRQKSLVFRAPRDLQLYVRAARIFLRNSAPLLLLPMIAQGNFVVERIVASFLGTSVIPALDYARFITDTVVTLSAMPLGLITLSKHGGARDETAMANLRQTSAMLMVLALAPGIHLSVEAHDLVAVVFARGAFHAHSVDVTSQVLLGLGVGLGATVVSYFMLKALNAQLRNGFAVLVVGIATALNMAFDLLFWKQLGPMVLGLGASVYGISCFIFVAWRMRLLKALAPSLAWMAVVIFIDVDVAYLLRDVGSPLMRVCLTSAVFGAVWGAAVLYVPAVRQVMSPILSRMPWLPAPAA